MESKVKVEEYILTRGMHLGFIKETFGTGAIIRFNPDTRRLTIDGRLFDDYRDLDILKRQSIKNPDNPFIVQYSDEALQDIRGGNDEAIPAVPKRVPNNDGMPIVQSDADSHQTIDISHTKVSKINQEKKEAARQKKQTGDMPIIQGHQSVEDRIAELKNKPDSDLSARAERVRLMGDKKASMPIVRDDSLGASSGSKSAAMNAGTPVGGRRADEVPTYVKDSANARKEEVESNRSRVADELGIDPLQVGIDEITPDPLDPVTAPVVESTTEESASAKDAELAAKDAEIAALKAQLEGNSKPQTETPAPPPKARKMPVTE